MNVVLALLALFGAEKALALSMGEADQFYNSGENGANVTIIGYDTESFMLFTNGIPDHEIDTTHRPREHNFRFRIPRYPVMADDPGCIPRSPIGVGRNGVILYNTYTAKGNVKRNITDVLDSCNGYTSPKGLYRYHDITQSCLSEGHEDEFIGVAMDGFPIYGPLSSEFPDSMVTEDDLDECQGRMVDGEYRYYVTDDSPYILRCFRGTEANLNVRTKYDCDLSDAPEDYFCACSKPSPGEPRKPRPTDDSNRSRPPRPTGIPDMTRPPPPGGRPSRPKGKDRGGMRRPPPFGGPGSSGRGGNRRPPPPPWKQDFLGQNGGQPSGSYGGGSFGYPRSLRDFIDVDVRRKPHGGKRPRPTNFPGKTRKPRPSRRPGVTRKPRPSRRPGVTRKPRPSRRPGVTRKPRPSRRPRPITVVTRPPHPDRRGRPTNDGDVTRKPRPSRRPGVTRKPRPSRRPGVTRKPRPSRRPGVTRKPRPSRRPGVTRKPRPSRRPRPITVVTRPPLPDRRGRPTNDGDVTRKPRPSRRPGVTRKPRPSRRPGVTRKPRPSRRPGVTRKPRPSRRPGVTLKPRPTRRSGVTMPFRPSRRPRPYEDLMRSTRRVLRPTAAGRPGMGKPPSSGQGNRSSPSKRPKRVNIDNNLYDILDDLF